MHLSFMFIVLICLCSHSTKGQYQSFFGNTNTTWTSVGSGMSVNEWTDSVAFEKDTVIANVDYKKFSWSRAYPENLYLNSIFYREDTTTGKLWLRYHPDSSDILIADLSLNVGDQYITPMTSVPKTVDSVYFNNSRKYIRFNTSYNSIRFQFIEGVGPTVGVLWTSGLILLCQFKDNYPNYVLNTPAYPGICNVSQLTDIKEPMLESVTVYPNPTSDRIKIRWTTKQREMTVYLLDPLGRQLLVNKHSNSTVSEIDLSHLSSGLYMLIIRDENNHLIKQEKILLN